MHVSIIGRGALGAVYGGLLIASGRARVSYVVRNDRSGPPATLRLERVETGEAFEVRPHSVCTTIDPAADVVVVTVRRENLDEALLETLGATHRPVVLLTPFFAEDLGRARVHLEDRLVAGLAGIVAYENAAGAFRYWLPSLSATLLDATGEHPPAVRELVQAWTRAAIPVRVQADLERTAPAITMAFNPLMIALEVAGSLGALARDPLLLRIACDAVTEGRRLGQRMGTLPAPIALATGLLHPLVLRGLVPLVRVAAPELVQYLDHHFGQKLTAQNAQLVSQMQELARERGLETPALAQLAARAASENGSRSE